METVKRFYLVPLGLLGYGVCTILLNLHNLGLIALSSLLAGAGFAIGGCVQIFAGLHSFKLGNTLGGTSFVSFGLYWVSRAFIYANIFNMPAPSGSAMAAFFMLWEIFALVIFLTSLRRERIIRGIVFGTRALLCFLLAIANLTQLSTLFIVAGVVGITSGSAAIYSACARIIDAIYGKKILPM